MYLILQRYRPFPSIIERNKLDMMWKWLCESEKYTPPVGVAIPPHVNQVSWDAIKDTITNLHPDAYRQLEKLFFIPRCFKLVSTCECVC